MVLDHCGKGRISGERDSQRSEPIPISATFLEEPQGDGGIEKACARIFRQRKPLR
jgi:hypothetical protein